MIIKKIEAGLKSLATVNIVPKDSVKKAVNESGEIILFLGKGSYGVVTFARMKLGCEWHAVALKEFQKGSRQDCESCNLSVITVFSSQ
jgi:hypothetical protein